MKYIKTFESNDIKELEKLCEYICNFFSKIDDKIIICDFDSGRDYFDFFNLMIDHRRKYLFRFIPIDYYFGDIDRFFGFSQSNSRFLNDYEIEIVNFIDNVINKYRKNQNMISYSDIPNIITEFTEDKFNYFVDITRNTKKYNL